MLNPRYSLVAYVKSPLGEFVEKLRRDLHPDLPHLSAHVTILPPRQLCVSESAAVAILERICGEAEPFEFNLGDVATFVPNTPTVYIRVNHSPHICRLHDQLNLRDLACEEEWPYIQHLTIAKMGEDEQAREAYEVAAKRWGQYQGNRRILLEKLTFVREEEPNRWVDVAPVQLGRRLVSK